MRENEKSNFAKMLTAVAELYGKKISSTLLSLYWAALERFHFTEIRHAITQHVNNSDVGQFMPKPADIVRYLEGDSDTHALQAWSKVESAIRRVGSYSSIAFDDPIIHAVINGMGGWSKLCSTLLDEMPFCANEFIKRYRGYFQKKVIAYPKYFPGLIEHNNQVNGYADVCKNLSLVGDEGRALCVISEGKDQVNRNITNKILKTSDMLYDKLSFEASANADNKEHT